jgi:hypothetical protein
VATPGPACLHLGRRCPHFSVELASAEIFLKAQKSPAIAEPLYICNIFSRVTTNRVFWARLVSLAQVRQPMAQDLSAQQVLPTLLVADPVQQLLAQALPPSSPRRALPFSQLACALA